MSFGRPPSIGETFRLAPPQRGSFPLDHDGDCKEQMKAYLSCLKSNKQEIGKCRALSRKYLECRMDNNLMDRDDMANLGLGDVGPSIAPSAGAVDGVEASKEVQKEGLGSDKAEEYRKRKTWLKT